MTSVILAGKRDSRSYSTTGLTENVVVSDGKFYQMLDVLSISAWKKS